MTEENWTNGKHGSAMVFDGLDDYLSVADDTSLNLATSFTLTGWVKRNVTGVGHYIYNSGTQSNRWNVGIQTSGELTFTEIGIADNLANTPLDTNWHHFSVVKDGDSSTNLTIYLDSIIDGSFSVGTVTTPSGAKDIGYQGAGTYFNGIIDDLRLYNYARTPAQIAYDYNRGKPVGHWKLDECTGTTAYDASGNGNNGTISAGDASGDNDSAGTCSSGATAPADEMWDEGTTGKRNASLDFDGLNDYVVVENSPSLQLEADLTIAAWIKVVDVTSDNTIAAKTNGSIAAPFDYRVDAPSGNMRLYRGNGTVYDSVDSTTVVGSGVWTHVAVAMNETTVTHFINGVESGTDTLSTTITDAGNNLYIGTRSDGIPDTDGQIDDVKIFNYALTNQQILQVMNEGAVRFGPEEGSP